MTYLSLALGTLTIFKQANDSTNLLDAPWQLLLFPFGTLGFLGASIGALFKRKLTGFFMGLLFVLFLCWIAFLLTVF